MNYIRKCMQEAFIRDFFNILFYLTTIAKLKFDYGETSCLEIRFIRIMYSMSL